MGIVRLLVLAGIVGGGWHYWNKQQTTAAEAAAISPAGFVAAVAPDGARAGEVLVIAPENCPSDAARRADDLAADLVRHRVAVRRSHSLNFSIENGDDAVARRLQQVLHGELPIVFVGNRGKANPTLAEVLAEYRR
ncbi:hypothetical protein [Azospira restricta]|uniref:Uncharacterized protein n=1 Tax=Azospira restricta TaxID=404405 RepID=A0A974SQF8_9RHOO|nr:hypothetical protein [Azospira restricta]QRJ64468.1 hypothetical protein IWH25_03705 [Azospira restricta]